MATWRELHEVFGDLTATEEFQAERRAIQLGRLIRQHREAAGLTQQQMAEHMHTSQTNISRLERGAVVPTMETLAKVASALREHLVVGIVTEETWKQSPDLRKLHAHGDVVTPGPHEVIS